MEIFRRSCYNIFFLNQVSSIYVAYSFNYRQHLLSFCKSLYYGPLFFVYTVKIRCPLPYTKTNHHTSPTWILSKEYTTTDPQHRKIPHPPQKHDDHAKSIHLNHHLTLHHPTVPENPGKPPRKTHAHTQWARTRLQEFIISIQST